MDSGFYQNNLRGRLAVVEMHGPNIWTQYGVQNPITGSGFDRIFYYEYSHTGAGRVGNQRLRVIGDLNGYPNTPINLDLGYTMIRKGG